MKHLQKGFSLIEIMVVVVILGILAALVVPKIMNRPDEARVVKAKQDVLAIQNAYQVAGSEIQKIVFVLDVTQLRTSSRSL